MHVIMRTNREPVNYGYDPSVHLEGVFTSKLKAELYARHMFLDHYETYEIIEVEVDPGYEGDDEE